MKIVKLIFLVLGVLLILFLIAVIYYNWGTSVNPEAKLFLSGVMPAPAPDGFYSGNASLPQASWRGKKFMATTATGINVFASGDRYSFHTYTGSSLTNSSQTVLKIDYNQAGNPWWLKFVVDEVVQTGPQQLVGKIQVRLIPHLAMTVGYFTLQQ